MMEKNNARLNHAKNALLSIETDDPDVAANVIDVIEQIDYMMDRRNRGVRTVREWMGG